MLHSLLLEWQFVTIMMVYDYHNHVFYEPKHIYWNVHRIATQAGVSVKPRVNARNTRMVFGPVLDGAPVDARFRNQATALFTPTSTTETLHAFNHPVIEPSRTW